MFLFGCLSWLFSSWVHCECVICFFISSSYVHTHLFLFCYENNQLTIWVFFVCTHSVRWHSEPFYCCCVRGGEWEAKIIAIASEQHLIRSIIFARVCVSHLNLFSIHQLFFYYQISVCNTKADFWNSCT